MRSEYNDTMASRHKADPGYYCDDAMNRVDRSSLLDSAGNAVSIYAKPVPLDTHALQLGEK